MKILTLNIFLRPYFINSYYNSFISFIKRKSSLFDIFYGDYKNKRLDLLIENINKEKYDIICLQEFFCDIASIRVNKLINFTKESNYHYSLPKKNNCSLLATSGLCILSKYEIIYENFIKYNCKIYFPNKYIDSGFQHIIIDKNGEHLNIINIHLQSGRYEWQQGVRKKQVYEIKKYVDDNIDKNQKIIINGDFNANKELWLHVNDLFPNYMDPFHDTLLNDCFTFRKFECNEVQRFDGILFYDKDKKYSIKSKIDPIKIKKLGYFTTISDHYSVISDIEEEKSNI